MNAVGDNSLPLLDPFLVGEKKLPYGQNHPYTKFSYSPKRAGVK